MTHGNDVYSYIHEDMGPLISLCMPLCSPEPTRILKQPEYKVVQTGMSAVFECKVKHDPSLIPTMTWLKDSGELPDDERYKRKKTPWLTLQSDDFLKYSCGKTG